MMVGPASVTQVTDLKFEVFAEFRTSALGSVLFNLIFDLPRVKQVKLKVGDLEDITKFIVTVLSSLGFLPTRLL